MWWAVVLLLTTSIAAAQPTARTPPACYGKNSKGETYVLQFGPTTTGGKFTWLCNTVPTPLLPAAPTDCITARWTGTAWECTPTNYLTAE